MLRKVQKFLLIFFDFSKFFFFEFLNLSTATYVAGCAKGCARGRSFMAFLIYSSMARTAFLCASHAVVVAVVVDDDVVVVAVVPDFWHVSHWQYIYTCIHVCVCVSQQL